MELHVPVPSDQDVYDLAQPVSAGPAAVATPQGPAPEAAPPAPIATQPAADPAAARARARAERHRRRTWRLRRRYGIPSWTVSLAVHLVILGALGAATLTPEGRQVVASIDSALVDTRGKAEELTPLYSDPTGLERDQAVGDLNATAPGSSAGIGIGSGPPSATPRVGVAGPISERSVLPSVQIAPHISPLALVPAAPARDLGGGGLISGEVAFETSKVELALDQIVREILRLLAQHKLTVLWLFDESESMKDDQRAIRQKFDRITVELKAHADPGKKGNEALTHAIVGFGQDLHYELEKPTTDIDQIGRAIDRLRVDDSGTENTMHAIQEVTRRYSSLVKKDHRLMMVLVTDESGDDGPYVEEARQALVSRGVPLYVIGRQSLFGYAEAHLSYVDPVTKDVYWPTIRRGPETADVELIQWDGLHERRDEQPSGFAPFELARLAKESGGIYFLLPSEENMRVRHREQAYSIATLKEYLPDYGSRLGYVEKRNRSDFRRTLYQVIQETKDYPFITHFPIDPAEMIPRAHEAGQKATVVLNTLLEIQKRLESLKKLREREPEKRWQAHYDLMLAQVVAYQVKAYEYRACLIEMVDHPPVPKATPTPELVVWWVLRHSPARKAPKEQTAKKYAEAQRLLKQVIERHPRTPWADLASDELGRGFGVERHEWTHSPRYTERGKLVPKY